MSLSIEAFDALRSHWAVSATGGAAALEKADKMVNERLAMCALGSQIKFSFSENEENDLFLERTALAYEIAAIEGLDELSQPSGENKNLRNQAVVASFRAFDIRRLMPIPTDVHDRLFFVLQLSALAYCGDRWSDLRRWYREHKDALQAPSVADVPWDRRLLYRLFNCWVRLFRKKGWDDLDRIREIIAGLREDQNKFEGDRLNNESQVENRSIALRLVALYHWAKATEILAQYMLEGKPVNPDGLIQKHFDLALKAASASSDAQHEMILRWLYASAQLMIKNSLWWATRTLNSNTSKFVHSLTHRSNQAMFELLPPQRAALLEKGLLDQAKTAIVVDMPTSGGKTLLAQFRILQALNQFNLDNGWVAYIAPTRALSAQITRRLRRDFQPIDLHIEQLTAAIEVDSFEEDLLENTCQPFHVLVATPEKLSLVIRNKKVNRPLALVVMDEAHNLETESRGLRIELLLATVKRDCPTANFLLLMPFVERADTIARWLAQDLDAGQAISLGTTPWKPNERIVGLYRVVPDDSKRAGWQIEYETLTATKKAMQLYGVHRVGEVKPLNLPKSEILNKGEQKGLSLQTAAIGAVMSARGTSVAVANKITSVWKMAQKAAESLPKFQDTPNDILLVQDFLRTEISQDFSLISLLDKGIGVHHAGLSDEVRTLIEWLAENNSLRMLCATSTIAQGMNFPVSSVFLASRFVPQVGCSTEMAPREFWNLAGRAGRINHDSVGVVGLAEGASREELISFLSRNTEALVSRLVRLLDDLAARGELHNLSKVLRQDQWDDFRCYIAHLLTEKKNLDAILADTDQLLRQTFGYMTLRNDPRKRDRAEALLTATQSYARELADNQGICKLADLTGFSPEGITKAISGMKSLEAKLTPSDWAPESLFGEGGKMADLFGVMLTVPQLKQQLKEISGDGFDKTRISKITRDWVNGKSIQEIAEAYFSKEKDDEARTVALTDACRAIYRNIVNSGTWGLSALSQVSGINFDALSEYEQRRLSVLPAMIYHGVRTEDAVLMRLNSAPRSTAEALGALYRKLSDNDEQRFSIVKARDFLKQLGDKDWNLARPKDAILSGSGYKRVWQVLAGETS